jgi:hypothetical protein
MIAPQLTFHWLRWFITASNTPRAISTPSPNGAPISMASISSFPSVGREHILCAWKAPRLGQETLKFGRIEAISDPMRELIEDLWPELVHKLADKAAVIGASSPTHRPTRTRTVCAQSASGSPGGRQELFGTIAQSLNLEHELHHTGS